MAKTHALMESLSANLGELLHSIHSDLTQPQKKFLRDGLVGLLRAGRPIVCRMARKPPDRRTKFLSRRDRMEANLNRPSVGRTSSGPSCKPSANSMSIGGAADSSSGS